MSEEATKDNDGCCAERFPCQCVLLGPCKACLPSTWYEIQDCTHLMLVVGLVSCLVVIIQGLIFLISEFTAVLSGDDRELIVHAIRTIISLIFAVVLVLYCFNIIGQYDQGLQEKQRKVREEREKLLNLYKGLLDDMHGLLEKSAESASGLAERSFESKRRDFQRFLDRARVRFSDMSDIENEILPQFKQFCINWLNVFKECSIDPVAHPKQVVEEELLMGMTSISEVATLVSERLRNTEVHFITSKRNEDNKSLEKRQEGMKESGGRRSFRQIADGSVNDVDNPQNFGSGFQSTNTTPRKPNQISWWTCGPTGCKCPPSPSSSGCPREVLCGCCRLNVLSRQHLTLLNSLVSGFIVVGLAAYEMFVQIDKISQTPDGKQKDVLPAWGIGLSLFALAGAVSCTMVLLVKFEQIDVVQRLEAECQELGVQNTRVEDQRKEMREFWGNAQQLTELWLHRTVPRLDLFKELHSHLEDAASDEVVNAMKQVNLGLENIEKRLGTLENWRGDGAIDAQTKKNFSKAINELCTEQDMTQLLDKLEDVYQGPEMRALTAF